MAGDAQGVRHPLTGAMTARKAEGMAVPPTPTPEQLVADLMLLLDLEPRGGDRFVGRRHKEGTGRVFGGQAIAQALGAARRTVPEDRPTHSLHAYFLRGGSDEHPIDFRVKRDLDGGSFSNRRVVASLPLPRRVAHTLIPYRRRRRSRREGCCARPEGWA